MGQERRAEVIRTPGTSITLTFVFTCISIHIVYDRISKESVVHLSTGDFVTFECRVAPPIVRFPLQLVRPRLHLPRPPRVRKLHYLWLVI